MRINLPEKRYYSIGEVANALDVKTSLLRFWEKEFKQIQPKKKSKAVSANTLLKTSSKSNISITCLKKRG